MQKKPCENDINNYKLNINIPNRFVLKIFYGLTVMVKPFFIAAIKMVQHICYANKK